MKLQLLRHFWLPCTGKVTIKPFPTKVMYCSGLLFTTTFSPHAHNCTAGILGIICFVVSLRFAHASLMRKLRARKKLSPIALTPQPVLVAAAGTVPHHGTTSITKVGVDLTEGSLSPRSKTNSSTNYHFSYNGGDMHAKWDLGTGLVLLRCVLLPCGNKSYICSVAV